MESDVDRNSKLLIIYSSVFLVVSEILFIKVSPQFYSLFNPLPMLILGIVLTYKELLFSIFISFIFILLISFLDSVSFIQNEFVVFQSIVSLIIILFFGIYHYVQIKKINPNKIISVTNLLFLIVLTIFYLTVFQSSEQLEIKKFFEKLVDELNKSYGIKGNQDFESLLNILIMLLPSINCLIFFITFSLNLIIAKFFVRKNNLEEYLQVKFIDFHTPIWFSTLYIIFFLTSIVLNSNSQFWILSMNSVICMSFCYLVEGFDAFNNKFKKIELNIYIKFTFIFLLFIFLGYVLLLIILVLGYLENIKKFKKS